MFKTKLIKKMVDGMASMVKNGLYCKGHGDSNLLANVSHWQVILKLPFTRGVSVYRNPQSSTESDRIFR